MGLQRVNTIFLSTQSKEKEVFAFLEELKALLGKEDFNIDSDLMLIKKKKPNELVYIKLKIKGDQKRRVLCVSFHYARDPMTFPYS